MNAVDSPVALEQFGEAVVFVPTRTFARMMDRILDGTPAAATPTPDRLRQLQERRTPIGQQGLFGIYAGIARGAGAGQDGVPAGDYILEVLDAAPKKLKWQAALDWAAKAGGALPTRKEQALLFANVPELFEQDWYWSCEQPADASAFAWSQRFSDGLQLSNHKSLELRVRAVRRLPIE